VAVVVVTSCLLAVRLNGALPGASSAIRIVLTIGGSQIGVGALNDFVDRNADARFQPSKPIPSGEIVPLQALAVALTALAVTLLCAASFGSLSLLVASVALSGGVAYDLGLKRSAWSVAGYLVGLLGLFAWLQVIADVWQWSLLLVYPAGACIIVAAHLANSAPDIEADSAHGLNTLASRLGPARTVLTIHLLSVALILPCALLAALSRSLPAAVLSLFSVALFVVGWSITWRFGASRRGRVLVFRVVAPALGMLSLAGLIGLQAL
jgi:4-hydroxybenzoate polyprenyltransferase